MSDSEAQKLSTSKAIATETDHKSKRNRSESRGKERGETKRHRKDNDEDNDANKTADRKGNHKSDSQTSSSSTPVATRTSQDTNTQEQSVAKRSIKEEGEKEKVEEEGGGVKPQQQQQQQEDRDNDDNDESEEEADPIFAKPDTPSLIRMLHSAKLSKEEKPEVREMRKIFATLAGTLGQQVHDALKNYFNASDIPLLGKHQPPMPITPELKTDFEKIIGQMGRQNEKIFTITGDNLFSNEYLDQFLSEGVKSLKHDEKGQEEGEKEKEEAGSEEEDDDIYDDDFDEGELEEIYEEENEGDDGDDDDDDNDFDNYDEVDWGDDTINKTENNPGQPLSKATTSNVIVCSFEGNSNAVDDHDTFDEVDMGGGDDDNTENKPGQSLSKDIISVLSGINNVGSTLTGSSSDGSSTIGTSTEGSATAGSSAEGSDVQGSSSEQTRESLSEPGPSNRITAEVQRSLSANPKPLIPITLKQLCGDLLASSPCPKILCSVLKMGVIYLPNSDDSMQWLKDCVITILVTFANYTECSVALRNVALRHPSLLSTLTNPLEWFDKEKKLEAFKEKIVEGCLTLLYHVADRKKSRKSLKKLDTQSRLPHVRRSTSPAIRQIAMILLARLMSDDDVRRQQLKESQMDRIMENLYVPEKSNFFVHNVHQALKEALRKLAKNDGIKTYFNQHRQWLESFDIAKLE